MTNITADELFRKVAFIATDEHLKPQTQNKLMHETLVLACAAGLEGEDSPSDPLQSAREAWAGSLFAKVDVLCKHCRIPQREVFDIQRMRHDSNQTAALTRDDLLYDCRALVVFISKVFGVDIPPFLTGKIPASRRPATDVRHVDYRSVRAIVRSFDAETITVQPSLDADGHLLRVSYAGHDYLQRILREGMQLNLLDVSMDKSNVSSGVHAGGSEPSALATYRMIVVEPDFLIDISSLAACFTAYGHSPLAYTINRMKPAANSQAILIGNFAGSALDDIINRGADYDWTETFRTNFREKALEYCTCPDLNQREPFKVEAMRQVKNIQAAVSLLDASLRRSNRPLPEEDTSPSHSAATGRGLGGEALLEPSFICEQLGLQGRIDLMTTDLRLLVEQKSGKNFNIEIGRPGEHGAFQSENHYVQVLLYYEALNRNFNLPFNSIDGRLLYSKYQMPGGLVNATYYKGLIDEAIKLRNQIVATEFFVARRGFGALLPMLEPLQLKQRDVSEKLWNNYVYPQLCAVTEPLHDLPPVADAYLKAMMTFVYREQLASRLGVVEGTGNAMADLWNMPLTEKKETGNIYTDLTITRKEQSSDYNGYDTITLAVPDQGEDFLPNFRLGDGVYLYPYLEGQEPDARRALLFRGTLISQSSDEATVHLSDGQQNPDIFEAAGRRNIPGDHRVLWAIEHSGGDIGTTSSIRSLHAFISDESGKRDLLLGQREPRRDAGKKLARSYSPTYDAIVEKAKQAKDYYLLVGPPGTGKTSMALQFLVREHLSSSTQGDDSILLMAYTNRAVDEICGMLSDNGIDFMRIGNQYSCDKRYRDHLLDHAIASYNKLADIKQKIVDTRVIVGTTSTLLSRAYLFNIKHFALAIVDEASQILEPGLVGLLTLPEKFILIGDYKQLPAVVQQDEEASRVEDPLLQGIGLTNCRNSLFERLIRQEQRCGRTAFIGVLNHQGRMHPDIAAFPNAAFYFSEHLLPVPLKHQLEDHLDYTLPSEDATDDLLKAHRVLFFPSEDCRQPDLSDKVNAAEARIVADLLRRIHRFYGSSFNPDKTVGVIVPYRNQIAMIRKEIERLGIPALLDISIDTVERYQGSQRDVIIYSFTIQQRYQLDFLTSNSFVEDGHLIDRKLNVALTRARKQLLLTGNVRTLSHNPLFRQLIGSLAG